MTDAAEESTRAPAPPQLSLLRLFASFLARGAMAFGGPVVQIAQLRADLVDRERWTDAARFQRTLAVYQVLPGPEATEMCCWFGHLARGRVGAFVAGLGFLLPGFVCVLACAWAYREFGLSNAHVASAVAVVQPAVLALVVAAVPKLARGVVARGGTGYGVAAGFLGELAGMPFAVPLLFGALFAIARRRTVLVAVVAVLVFVAWLPFGPFAHEHATVPANADATARLGTASPFDLLATGLEAGLLTFGGAYTAIPFVRADVVLPAGFLDDAQFLDALAVAGVLPAPLVMFTTFAGFLGGGFLGAVAITFGVFAPAFAFSCLQHAAIERVVHAKGLHAALDGVAAAVVGLVAATAVRLCFLRLHDLRSIACFALALVLLSQLRTRLAPLLVIAVGAVVGLALG